MKKSSELFDPQRQSIVAIILILLKFIRMLVRQLWPLALILLIGRRGSLEIWVIGGLFIIAFISVVASVLSYFRFYYYISNHHLNIDKGILRRTHLKIPFERIQTIDFEQNVIHRMFKVVRVRIDSAGTRSEEISFDALEKYRADLLRDYILAQKAVIRSTDEEKEEKVPEAQELLLKLSPSDLLKIGVSQNHLRTAGIIIVFALAIFEDISRVLDQYNVFGWIGEELESVITGSVLVVLFVIPVFLLIAFLATLIRTVLVHYDLRFWKTATGFRLQSGLITQREKSAQKNKIQIIAWSTDPVKRLFKLFRLSLYQASSVDVIGEKSLLVPGCYKAQVERTIASVIPGAPDAEYETHTIHPAARARFILFAGILPCVVITLAAYLLDRPVFYWVWLVYFPLSVWMAQLYYRKRKLQLHTDLAIGESGIFGNHYEMLEIFKVQSVSIHQSFYQWRKDLATVTMYTASGDVRIPFIPMRKAEQIRDYILYRIERDNRHWM